MKNNKDRLSHLSNAYWHLDLITNTNSPEIQAIKEQIETLINKENK